MTEPIPFTIDIPDAVLADLRDRLVRTRWAPDLGNSEWRYGASRDYLEHFVDYWCNEYDWRETEAAMNRFDNFRVDIDGQPIHFIHQRGVGPSPTPLILSHGWPWSFWDLREMIGPLSDPGAHGGDPADAFHVIVPSLPGFAFSSPLAKVGIGAQATAEMWRRLMHDVLGYERFGAQGGDFGAIITQHMAETRADDLIGVHLNRYKRSGGAENVGFAPLTAGDYGPDEVGEWERQQAALPLGASHLAVHTHDPQSLAYGMHDSPVALAAWLLERRRAWSACGGDIEKSFSKEFLAATLTLYWVTDTFWSSVRMYWETTHAPPSPSRRDELGRTIAAPLAVGVLPHDVIVLPRRHAEEDTDLRRWTKFERGGHFGAAEVPELLVEDLRAFFRPLREHL